MWETRGGGGQLGAGRRIILWEKWETNITFPSCSSLCSSPSSRLPLCASLRHSPVPRAAWAPGYAPLPTDTVCLPPVRGKEKVGGGGREGTVGGTWATPASGLRTRTQLSPVRDGRGLDAPRKPRDGFSRLGREEQHSAQAGGVQHRGAERAPPAPRRSRTVRDKRDEKPPSPAR